MICCADALFPRTKPYYLRQEVLRDKEAEQRMWRGAGGQGTAGDKDGDRSRGDDYGPGGSFGGGSDEKLALMEAGAGVNAGASPSSGAGLSPGYRQ